MLGKSICNCIYTVNHNGTISGRDRHSTFSSIMFTKDKIDFCFSRRFCLHCELCSYMSFVPGKYYIDIIYVLLYLLNIVVCKGLIFFDDIEKNIEYFRGFRKYIIISLATTFQLQNQVQKLSNQTILLVGYEIYFSKRKI